MKGAAPLRRTRAAQNLRGPPPQHFEALPNLQGMAEFRQVIRCIWPGRHSSKGSSYKDAEGAEQGHDASLLHKYHVD